MTTFTGPPLGDDDAAPLTLGGFLGETARRNAGREAVAFHGPGAPVRWTYADLAREARRVARALMAAGVETGERVALLMGNRPEWVASAFGVALAGGVLVPVNTFLERPELAYLLDHSDAAFLLTQAHLRGHTYLEDAAAVAPPGLRGVASIGEDPPAGVAGWPGFLAAGDAVTDVDLDRRASRVTPEDDTVVIYTSGTTATPKGVLHAHRAPCLQARRFVRHLALDAGVRAWSAFPMFWTAGFAMHLLATLAAGGCLVLQESFEPGEALALLEEERVTTPHAWPHQLAELEEHPAWDAADLSSLRHVESFGPFGRHPSVDVAPDAWSPRAAYGLTETFTIVTSHPADEPAAVRDASQGRLLPGVALRILDPGTGAPLPAGRDGQIAVAGPTLMRRYVKVPPEETFDADGFFRTGDAGSMDEEGCLHWTGRTSDLIKTGGANVSPVEIETELLHHPALKAVVVVGVPHATLGEIVVVCAVPHRGADLDEESVRAFLRGRVASYKIPRHVVFVREEELSLTGNAKIRPEELRAIATERVSGRD